MKKLLWITLAGLLILIPIVVSATPIVTTGPYLDSLRLKVTFTPGITGGGYYTDYQAFVNGGDKKVELFCVENQAANINQDELYYRYALNSSSTTNRQAAWLAEKYWNDSDSVKGQAQLAIWDLLDTIGTGSLLSGLSQTIIADYDFVSNNAGSLADFTGNWLLARNDDRQDYLMRAPVPEPATMMLLGVGLIGLAGANRKKFKK